MLGRSGGGAGLPDPGGDASSNVTQGVHRPGPGLRPEKQQEGNTHIPGGGAGGGEWIKWVIKILVLANRTQLDKEHNTECIVGGWGVRLQGLLRRDRAGEAWGNTLRLLKARLSLFCLLDIHHGKT